MAKNLCVYTTWIRNEKGKGDGPPAVPLLQGSVCSVHLDLVLSGWSVWSEGAILIAATRHPLSERSPGGVTWTSRHERPASQAETSTDHCAFPLVTATFVSNTPSLETSITSWHAVDSPSAAVDTITIGVSWSRLPCGPPLTADDAGRTRGTRPTMCNIPDFGLQ